MKVATRQYIATGSCVISLEPVVRAPVEVLEVLVVELEAFDEVC